MLILFKAISAKILKKIRFSYIWKSNIHPTSKIESGSSVFFSSFDCHSFCGYDCEIYYSKIGRYTSIANQVVIGGARHPIEWVGMSPVFYKGRDSIKLKLSEHLLKSPPITFIGHDVWIGRSSIIISGVQVGNGAVIGAGSVVTKDVPPYAIVAGNPAKVIKYRFDPDTINTFEKIKWWELDETTLKYLAQFICNPNLFINAFSELNEQRKSLNERCDA